MNWAIIKPKAALKNCLQIVLRLHFLLKAGIAILKGLRLNVVNCINSKKPFKTEWLFNCLDSKTSSIKINAITGLVFQYEWLRYALPQKLIHSLAFHPGQFSPARAVPN